MAFPRLDPLPVVLKRIKMAHPNIILWEVEPLRSLEYSHFRAPEGPHPKKSWRIDELLETVETDFKNMSREEKIDLGAERYNWGYQADGRVTVFQVDKDGAAAAVFVQAGKSILKKIR